MRHTIFDMPIASAPFRVISIIMLKLLGWRLEGEIPTVAKCVAIVGPHTSNWDFPIATFFAFKYRIRASFLMKHTMFRGPLGVFLKLLGGIPVERGRTHGLVGHAIDLFKERDVLMLGITPEGTRKKVDSWKTGFYSIAEGAHVPIAPAYLDYKRKVGAFGPLIMPSGDMEADIKKIADIYAGVTARHPELTGPPNIAPPA